MSKVHVSLFSGFGGADLAAQWMGWENAFWCEIDGFCQQILRYWFPKSIGYENIKETDFTSWRGKVDVLTGGFPCQPFSVAGQKGSGGRSLSLAGNASRYTRDQARLGYW